MIQKILISSVSIHICLDFATFSPDFTEMAEQVAPMGPEHGHDEQGGQKKIGVKRKDDLQVVNPASPSKQSKTDVR